MSGLSGRIETPRLLVICHGLFNTVVVHLFDGCGGYLGLEILSRAHCWLWVFVDMYLFSLILGDFVR